MPGLTLDAGALIAYERSSRIMSLRIDEARALAWKVAIPAGVLAQVWRDGRRQARVARLLDSPSVDLVVLDDLAARLAGQLCGMTGTSDIVDASVMVCARSRGRRVVTSDPDDLRRLDPTVELIVV